MYKTYSVYLSIPALLRKICLVVAMLFGFATNADAKTNEACFPQLFSLIDSEIEAGTYPGATFVVDQGGEVIIDTQRGQLSPSSEMGMPDDAIFRIYSMTKPITSVAIMMLVERGEIALEDPLSNILPEFADMKVLTETGLVPAQSQMTIRDLLRHSSGLTYGFFGQSPARSAYLQAGIGSEPMTNAEFSQSIATLPLEHQPGTTWEYSRATDILGYVVEVVSGLTLDAFLKAEILMPLGMTDTDFYIPAAKQDRAAGDFIDLPDHFLKPVHLSGGGGMVSTAQDYLAFLRMLRNGGELNGTRLLSAESVAEMTKDQLFKNGIKPGTYYFVGPGHGFGLGFGIKLAEHEYAWPGPVGTYFWVGYGGTSFWVDPQNDLIAVFLVQTLTENLPRYAKVRGLFYADFGLNGIAAKDCISKL